MYGFDALALEHLVKEKHINIMIVLAKTRTDFVQ